MPTDTKSVNYPDILGYITGGDRLNADVIQCALTTRPDTIRAGQNFEVLFLVQNAADVDIDVTINLKLPDRDTANNRGRFFSKSSRLLVGLQPAEVGYVTLPASCSPKTQPGEGYKLTADLKVDRLNRSRKPMRIRQNAGGGDVIMTGMPEKTIQLINALQKLSWEAQGRGRRNHIEATFTVAPPGIASLGDSNAGWQSLWTMRDYLDENVLQQRVQEHLNIILPALTNKETIFKPLLELTLQTYAETGNYPLKTAEGIYITKLLTLMLWEFSEENPLRSKAAETKPQWYRELLKLLFEDSRYRDYPQQALKNYLYPFLVTDAILRGFKMVNTVLNEDFGSPDDQEVYASNIVSILKNGGQLSYAQVYLPLIAGGIIANNRITMPRENVRDTAFAISKAHEGRAAERTEENAFVFNIIKTLVDRAIDSVSGF